MTCARGDQCECTGRQMTLRMFCEHWSEPERPRGALETQSDTYWATVPEADRKRCLDHLRSKVPADVIAKWQAQYERGNCIGSDDIRFHLGVGMTVRNTLREVLKDSELPGSASVMRGLHWDDYYVGALHALVQP